MKSNLYSLTDFMIDSEPWIMEASILNYKNFGSIALAGILSSQLALAQNYQYPELMVVPKATATLQREAKKEKTTTFTRYLPIQVAAAGALLVGLRARNRTENGASSATSVYGNTAIGAGVAFLSVTTILGVMTSPYRDGLSEVSRMRGKGRAGILDRERRAEEVLDDAGDLAWNLSLWSAISTTALSGAIASSADDDSVKAAAAMGVLVGLVPLFWQARATTVMERHHDYKKRIYGPVASLGLFRSPHSKSTGPMVSLTLPLL